jgi:hypothetical protein
LQLNDGKFVVCTFRELLPRYYSLNEYAWSLVSGESLVNTLELPVIATDIPETWEFYGGVASYSMIQEDDDSITTYLARDGVSCISKFSMEIVADQLSLISQDWEWLATWQTPAPSIEIQPDQELPYMNAIPGKKLMYENNQRTQATEWCEIPGAPWGVDPAFNAYTHLTCIDTDTKALLYVSPTTLDRVALFRGGYKEGKYWSVYTPKTILCDPTFLECKTVFHGGDGVEHLVALLPNIEQGISSERDIYKTGVGDYVAVMDSNQYINILTVGTLSSIDDVGSRFSISGVYSVNHDANARFLVRSNRTVKISTITGISTLTF